MLDCDALAAPSRAFARAVAKTYDVPQPFVVLNGRNPPPATALPVAREPVAFISGRLWDEGKNVAALDAAAGLARTPVAAAGPLTGPDDLNRFEAAHLELLGRLDGGAIADRLARSLIYASSALYEPFGLGVLEAAQAGCALVLSDIPTFRELWNDAAVFVPPRDARAFATTIDALAADPQRAQALGAAAKARAATYSAATMVAQTLALYRHLGVASRRRTRREQAA
jgi:glycosyltransferase involved in cell wall biosynthesis